MKKAIFIIISLFSFSVLSFGADQESSVDCKHALNKVEKFICHDVYISLIDSEILESYKILLSRGVKDLKENKILWHQQVEDCSKVTSEDDLKKCLVDSYQDKSRELRNLIAKTDYPEEGFGSYEMLDWWPSGFRTNILRMFPKNRETCSEFGKFINEFKTKKPYTCVVKSSDDNFVRPTWEVIDNKNNDKLITRMFEILYTNSSLKDYYKDIYNNKKYIIRKAFIEPPTDMDGTGVVYEFSKQEKCDENSAEWIYRNYDKGHIYFIEKQDGDLNIVSDGYWFVELILHNNRAYFYGFSSHKSDENWHELDHEMQDIFIYKKTRQGYLRACRFQFTK
jgi:uncharacterized protein